MKKAEVKGRGRKLTLGSKEEEGSGLMNKHTNECSAERKFREWRVKSDKMTCDGLFIEAKGERIASNQP